MDSVRRPVSCEVPLSIALVLDAGSPGLVHAWDPAAWLDADKPLAPIHEDFAAGLANWACSKEDWKQDIAGVRTGSLALLRDSLNMRDYDLEFFGRMEAQSIGWVVRAADTSHYHALRILTGGSSGTAELIRYAVLADERDEPIKMPLSVPLSRSSGCRIKMSIRGNEFTLFLNNEPAAQWTDDRLPEGGVGFFADGNDRARLYWVKVTPLKQAPAGEQATLRGPVRQRRNREHRIMGV